MAQMRIVKSKDRGLIAIQKSPHLLRSLPAYEYTALRARNELAHAKAAYHLPNLMSKRGQRVALKRNLVNH